jgi:hypothetical protein
MRFCVNASRRLTLSLTGARAHVRVTDGGPDLDLDAGVALLPPEVALAPVRDSARFRSYFDVVLGGMQAAWTAPASK